MSNLSNFSECELREESLKQEAQRKYIEQYKEDVRVSKKKESLDDNKESNS
ncbi:hypothetical protein D3C81_654470 [compost metagenome]